MCGWMFGNKPLKITKWGHFKVSKWSLAQNGPFRILEMAPFSDFQGLISKHPATFTAQGH